MEKSHGPYPVTSQVLEASEVPTEGSKNIPQGERVFYSRIEPTPYCVYFKFWNL